MTRRTAPARKIKTAAEIAAEQSSRLAHLSAGGECDFIVVVRFLGETSRARTIKISASAERADHVAQMSVMQLGPRATVAMVYGAAGAGALGC